MTRNQKIIFAVCILAQVGIILGLFADRLWTLKSGREVVLRTTPIDPRDIVRGQYVALRYEINSLSADILSGDAPKLGDTVYVTLTQNSYNNIWTATEFSLERPRDFSVYIRGTVTKIPTTLGEGGETNPVIVPQRVIQQTYQVAYDIEKYFVEDAIAKDFERSGRLKVYAAIDTEGRAVLKRAEPLTNADVDSINGGSVGSQLSIREMTHAPYIQEVNKQVTFSVTIVNSGSSSSPTTTLEIFVPGSREGQKPLTTYTVPSLRPNGIVTFKRVEEFAYPYTYTVGARLVPVQGLTPFAADLERTNYVQITKAGETKAGMPVIEPGASTAP